jgi:putative ABC transport system permease protein
MFKIIDHFLFTLERIWQHRTLVLWVLLGLMVATTLALSLPLYVDSVYSDLLASRLGNPPFAFRFRYLGAWNGNIGRTDVENANAAIQQSFPDTVRLPVAQRVTYVRGGVWGIRSETSNIGQFAIGTVTGIENQISIVAGEWSDDMEVETGEDGETIIPILLPESALYTMGLQVGDTFTAQRSGSERITLRVAALWRALNENDPAWIFPPKFFDEVFIVHDTDLWTMLEGIEDPIDETGWFLVFDGREQRASDVESLLGRIADGQRIIDTVLPGIRQDLSPVDGLRAFSNEVNTLTQQLFIIVMPVGGLVFYFVSLVAGLLVNRQIPDDVKLRSRGMSRRSLVGLHLTMWLSMVAAALGVAIAASPYVVRLVVQTASFLRFDAGNPAPEIIFTPQSILIATLTGLIAASSGLWLAWRATGQNVNSLRRSSARQSKAWWQRMYLDVMLFVPGAYVLFTLWQQGGLATDATNAFGDPLTFIGPTIFTLGLVLLFLRLWQILLNVLSNLLTVTNSVALLMTLRELTRSAGRYRGVLLMISFTLALIGFTSSMAGTVDSSLIDTIDYQVGADLVLVTAVDAQTENETDSTSGQTTTTVTGFNAPPVQNLAQIDGIAQFSRVGNYSARLVLNSQRVDGTVLGVDRGSIAAVTHFREDFANDQLAALFNNLAGTRTGIILSRQTAETYDLIVGQEVNIQISALGEWYDTRVRIMGLVDYFPSLDPSAGFFAMTNIDPIFELVGSSLPYDIWLSLEPGVDPDTVKAQIAAINFPVVRWLSVESALAEARADPARRGVLGFLSVGFVASITLTLIAAIIQSVASFRAQHTQLGVLRAMGLPSFSLGSYMVMLHGISTSSGILSGTSIGVLTTLLFLPLLDFSAGLPPYLVRVAWNELNNVYLIFAIVSISVTLSTTLFLSRQQLAAVVRLGDG